MNKSVAEIIQEVENRGELEHIAEMIRVIGQFESKFQFPSVEMYRDFEGFSFDNRLYVRYGGGWYDGTNHPGSPFPEWGDRNPGYHIADIEKRTFGSAGKILEELEEFNDAQDQGCKIMQLVELSDMVGAIEGLLEREFPGFTLDDLIKMSNITRRAFRNGHRG